MPIHGFQSPWSSTSTQVKCLFNGTSPSKLLLPPVRVPGSHISTSQLRLDDDNGVSVLEYAVRDLQVTHIAVVGHTGCGGVEYSYTASQRRTNLSSPLERWLGPVTDLARSLQSQESSERAKDAEAVASSNSESDSGLQARILNLTEKNVEMQVENIRMWAAALRHTQTLHIHGWVYQLENGTLRDLNVTATVTVTRELDAT